MASSPGFALRGLYAITPETADGERLAAAVEQALAGGAALVQYRAKALAPAVALEQARRLAGLCRARGVPLIVNDSVELALACGADGVHLGRDDIGLAKARAALPGAIVGVSCYANPAAARAAAEGGADYVAIGSVFSSTTKPGAARATLAQLGEARRAGGLPVAAIGGITPANVGEVVAAGADMAAVISALFDAGDILERARELSGAFHEASSPLDEEPRRAHG
ncbi:MAG TPA: thiamine phosphate synthase [Usitatibacter sp.]|nr:thiamine phosphate synthase [Usitatibacter sp.]